MEKSFNYPVNVARNLVLSGYKMKAMVKDTGDIIYMNSHGDLRILYNQSLKSKLANKIASSFTYPNKEEVLENSYYEESRKLAAVKQNLQNKNNKIDNIEK